MSVTSQLTIRERLVIKHMMNGESATEAMLKAGYSRNTAEKQQRRFLDNPRLQHAIQGEMDRWGISCRRLARCLADGLNATRTVHADGAIVEVPDHAVRHRYLQTALLLMGAFREAAEGEPDSSYEDLIRRLRGVEAPGGPSPLTDILWEPGNRLTRRTPYKPSRAFGAPSGAQTVSRAWSIHPAKSKPAR